MAGSDQLSPLEAHSRAQEVFAGVLAGLDEGDLGSPTPCSEWTVHDLIGHVVAGNQWTAGTEVEVPSDLAGLRSAHASSAEGAQSTFSAPDGMTRVFKARPGELPGAVFIQLRTIDVLAHSWDLARASGSKTDLDPELAEQLLAASRQLIRPDFRGPDRPFAEEHPCDDSRPAADRLAAFLGRTTD